MPRTGKNPAKGALAEFIPKDVTVCTITYIPELAGYWEQSLEVLKLSLASLFASTDGGVDIFVFDNGSCEQVRTYLQSLRNSGQVNLLVLSARNMGKLGAWNVMFPACPGKYIAYFDSDVLFYRGWLEHSREIITAFDNVGMVTACPTRTDHEFRDAQLSSTLEYARDSSRGVTCTTGNLADRGALARFAESTGRSAHPMFGSEHEDVLLEREGIRAFASAGHYQFMSPKSALAKVLPLPSERAIGNTKIFDERLNRLGMLRLSTERELIRHLGNTVSDDELNAIRLAYPELDRVQVLRHEGDGAAVRALRYAMRSSRVRTVLRRTYSTLYKALR